ncbi:MAG: Na+/H+ antiporter subunit E [Taibaiella sp.]|nr:Na+/H+ antiporter subunit E [Taibaiella sp.]
MVKQFLMNLVLTFLWVALTGHLNYANFAVGYFLGFVILWMISRKDKPEQRKYFTRVPKILEFLLYFLYDTIRANLQVAYDVITPKYFMRPGVVAFPMDAKNEFEITMLANIIALSPGTLVIDVNEPEKIIYIHVMYLNDEERFIQRMKNGIEKKLLEIIR